MKKKTKSKKSKHQNGEEVVDGLGNVKTLREHVKDNERARRIADRQQAVAHEN